MRRTRFDDWPCPIARTTDLIGDWWTPLVLREAFSGRRRFEELSESLGVPRAVLTARLKRLCADGLLVAVPYQDNPVRYEYRLTDKGRAFWDVLAAMWRWGSDWLFDEDGPPVVLADRRVGRRGPSCRRRRAHRRTPRRPSPPRTIPLIAAESRPPPAPPPARVAAAAIGAVFFVNGATLSSWTPRLPEVQADLGISDAALGLTLVGMGVGGLAASLFSGWLVDRRGSRTMTMTTSAAMSLWLPLLGVASTAVLVFAVLLVLGALDGLTDVAMNSQAVELQRHVGRSIITRFHAAVVARRGDRRHHGQPSRRCRHLVASRNCLSLAPCSWS